MLTLVHGSHPQLGLFFSISRRQHIISRLRARSNHFQTPCLFYGHSLRNNTLGWLAVCAPYASPSDFVCCITFINVHSSCVSQYRWTRELMARARLSMNMLIASCNIRCQNGRRPRSFGERTVPVLTRHVHGVSRLLYYINNIIPKYICG